MRSKLLRILLEFAVVFAGVYAAFALDEYRSRKEDDQKRYQILLALQTDFADSQAMLDHAAVQVAAAIDSILADYDAGKRPEIGNLVFTVTFRSGAWDAILAAGGVNVLDIEVILAVEEYYENVQALEEATDEARQRSADLILPNLDDGNDSFYEKNGPRLKKKYRWYMDSLRDFRVRVRSLRDQNAKIVSLVDARLADRN